MRNVWTIARREYHRFFTSPVAYVVAFVMLFVVGDIFTTVIGDAARGALGGGYGPPPAPDMSPVVGSFAFLMILMIPALTMRLVADEHRMGTMELLLTAPVRDWELIVGKWLGAFLYMLTLIAATLIYAFVLNALESPGIDQQQLMTSYLGLILMTAALLALGVGVSAIFSNPIASFFAALGVFVLLWWVIAFPSYFVTAGSDVFRYLHMQSHFQDSMLQGVINLSDLAYFLSLIGLGLFAGTTAVEARRWG
jgi:ABC-2 type transport system permease protein